jgi:hypothetical protein
VIAAHAGAGNLTESRKKKLNSGKSVAVADGVHGESGLQFVLFLF